ncbi:MAG: hypothetical protein JWO35_721 [Candidatus Saccharibacteria bacterium]|nr:hypothetical protein [Candidatus Saccharibacteria bacterium]
MSERAYEMQNIYVAENTTQQELDIIKSEMHERSRQAGVIEVIGTLSGETTSEYWTGSISLKDRLESGELTAGDVQEGLHILEECYVLTQKGGTIGCIDGRPKEGYDDNDPAMFGRKLGPKSPGGTVIDGIADRISLGVDDESHESVHLLNDIDEMAEVAIETGYQPGDHVADQCADGNCGCGAVDGAEKHCETINLPAKAEVRATTAGLLGEAFDEDTFNKVADSVEALMSIKENYMMAKQEIIAELVRLNPEAAPVLVGKHNEIVVVLDMVSGETLHTDHYAARTNNKIHAFNYDVWHTFEMAEARFADDPEKLSLFKHARIAIAVTALMDLTDGSLLLATRTPRGSQ